MSKAPLLTRSQWIGAILLLLLLLLGFVAIHFLPTPSEPFRGIDTVLVKDTTAHRPWVNYDSLRAVRRAYYDSVRLVRRDSIHQAYTTHRDSLHRADSLWWDSVRHADDLAYEARYGKRPVKKDTILDLNTADTLSLQMIRGIGPSMARRIVRYRERLGGYVSVQQVKDPQCYTDQYGHASTTHYVLPDSILSVFTVSLDSVHPILINHASINRMQRHPYISYTMAKDIYTLRRQHLKLRNMDDLRELPYMTDSVLSQLRPYLSFEK